MTIINNITNVVLNNEYTNSSKIELIIFKNSLTQLLLMNENLYNDIYSKKSSYNDRELFCFDIENPIKENNGLEIIYWVKKLLYNKIFFQLSNKYRNYKKTSFF